MRPARLVLELIFADLASIIDLLLTTTMTCIVVINFLAPAWALFLRVDRVGIWEILLYLRHVVLVRRFCMVSHLKVPALTELARVSKLNHF